MWLLYNDSSGDPEIHGKHNVVQVWVRIFTTYVLVRFEAIHQAVNGASVLASQIHHLTLPGRGSAVIRNRNARTGRSRNSLALSPVEKPDLVPGSGEILVDVAAACVNFMDTGIRRGLFGTEAGRNLLGVESAGRVLSVGNIAPLDLVRALAGVSNSSAGPTG